MLPSPATLLTEISPPISSTSWRQMEAPASAAEAAGDAAVGLGERGEQPALFGRNADAGIADREGQANASLVAFLHRHIDVDPALFGEFQALLTRLISTCPRRSGSPISVRAAGLHPAG